MAADCISPGEAQEISKRGLTQETCQKWGYTVTSHNGKPCQVANYKDDEGSIVAQKIRYPGKDFTFLGDPRRAGLYGKHLWRDGGRRVVITEGEIDALSVSQLQDNKWPVVSLPNGASGASASIKRDLEWLEKFEEVVFLLDNDEHGIKAVHECAPLLSPGKAKVAKLPLKDANDMLVAQRGKELIDAIWGAKVYRPDGIINGADIWEAITAEDKGDSVAYPWAALQAKTHGIRKRELVTITAGSGIGKSAVCKELAHHLHGLGNCIGYVALEESTKRTAIGLMSIELSKPLHLTREGTSDEDFKQAYSSTVGSGRIYLYDHFGSIDSSNLLSRLRYLARGCGCDYIFLDHLSIVVSGIGDGDERRLIDNTMTSLRSLVEETGVGMVLVSHLKRPEGKGHEEGAHTSLSQLRGSAAIAQLSDIVIGLERDQQDPEDSNVMCMRILKNRFTGETGEAGYLRYDRESSRLQELEYVEGQPPKQTSEGHF